MYIAIAIVAFGLLIAIHELGHFSMARLFGVQVNEFAFGMGPKILSHKGKETVYSWRLLPFGGFCAMEGEDEDSQNPHAFTNKPWWQQAVILVAGAAFNAIAGFIVIAAILATSNGFTSTQIVGLAEGFPEGGLQTGDVIVKVDGESVGSYGELSLMLSRGNENGIFDFVVKRGGERVNLSGYQFLPRDYPAPDGGTQYRYGIDLKGDAVNAGNTLKYSLYETRQFVRMVKMGLVDLFTGKVAMTELSGPVGIVAAVDDIAKSSANTTMGLRNLTYFFAFIAINLAVMNLLPIPALDGGRIVFLLVTTALEKLFRRKISRKIEGYVHAGTFVLLIGVMLFTLVSDVMKLL
ncbi:MAG: site-2 protease family protein [Oscillospiraceae bacterium]|jgi:regulator of sigma E protease|nr:site-2 protease family protein [Oscillospiraceae bacterium]